MLPRAPISGRFIRTLKRPALYFLYVSPNLMKKTLLLLSVLSTGACAYAIDDSIQDVKIVTPGARGAACDAYVEGLKYRVKPPQIINLYKSKEDLVVDCKAPGNRRKVVYIKPSIEPSAAWNITNAGVGLTWDYASAALFRYPDVIEVNFTDTPVTDPPLPAQNSTDIRQPEEYQLEEFSPSAPRMNADRSAPPVEILRRERASRTMSGYDSSAAFSESSAVDGGKGDLMDIIQDMGSDLNPASDNSADAPISLLPGQ